MLINEQVVLLPERFKGGMQLFKFLVEILPLTRSSLFPFLISVGCIALLNKIKLGTNQGPP